MLLKIGVFKLPMIGRAVKWDREYTHINIKKERKVSPEGGVEGKEKDKTLLLAV